MLGEPRMASYERSIKAVSGFLHLTECVLSCQREAEDDMDSYQVPCQFSPAAPRPVVHSAA